MAKGFLSEDSDLVYFYCELSRTAKAHAELWFWTESSLLESYMEEPDYNEDEMDVPYILCSHAYYFNENGDHIGCLDQDEKDECHTDKCVYKKSEKFVYTAKVVDKTPLDDIRDEVRELNFTDEYDCKCGSDDLDWGVMQVVDNVKGFEVATCRTCGAEMEKWYELKYKETRLVKEGVSK